jgi:hypothetical protein
MDLKEKGPVTADTVSRPDNPIEEHGTDNRGRQTWQASPQTDFQRHLCNLEVIADWRDELVARIARETLIFELADCCSRGESAGLEAEVRLFKQVCRAISGAAEEPLSERRAA